MSPLLIKHFNCLVKAHFLFQNSLYNIIPHSEIKISFQFAVLTVIKFETVTQISRSINPDVFVDNLKTCSRPVS